MWRAALFKLQHRQELSETQINERAPYLRACYAPRRITQDSEIFLGPKCTNNIPPQDITAIECPIAFSAVDR